MHATFDAGERQLLMQVGRRCNGHGVDTGHEQLFDAAEPRTAERRDYPIALLAIGIYNTDKLYAGKIAEDAGMVAAHDTNAHHTYA